MGAKKALLDLYDEDGSPVYGEYASAADAEAFGLENARAFAGTGALDSLAFAPAVAARARELWASLGLRRPVVALYHRAAAGARLAGCLWCLLEACGLSRTQMSYNILLDQGRRGWPHFDVLRLATVTGVSVATRALRRLSAMRCLSVEPTTETVRQLSSEPRKFTRSLATCLRTRDSGC